MALLVVALAVTANRLNTLRAEKAHTEPTHYCKQTGGGEGKTKEGIYDEVGEGTALLEDRVSPIRSWNWKQWKGDSMRAWARRPALRFKDVTVRVRRTLRTFLVCAL